MDDQELDVFRNPVIVTPRIRLRPFTMDDAEQLFRYASDPDVTRYLMWDTHRTIEDTKSFLRSLEQGYQLGGMAVWAIELKAEREVIGAMGLHRWRAAHSSVEVGYWIGKPFWGRGIVVEALKGVLEYMFDHDQMYRIEALVESDNHASSRVLEKAGMQLEGELRAALLIKGTRRNMKVYSILLDEWKTLRDQNGL